MHPILNETCDNGTHSPHPSTSTPAPTPTAPARLQPYLPLERQKIAPWQVCVRTGVPLETLKRLAPQWTLLHKPPPPCAPKWAGGTGKKTPQNAPWTYKELEATHLGAESGALLPYEASLLLEISGKRIETLLKKLQIPLPECPPWLPNWAQTSSKEHKNTTAPDPALQPPLPPLSTPWSVQEEENLQHYWNLKILSPLDISLFLKKTPHDIQTKANELKLCRKRKARMQWGGATWEFEEDSPSDPKLLEPNTQRLVAEASATRFSLLYEEIQSLEAHTRRYKEIQREMEKIIKLQSRIFSKYIGVKSRKYNYHGHHSWIIQSELEQAGKAAIFECLRRWHPNRKIRYSRGAICIAITREMIAWVEKQRLIELPDRVRAVARKLKQAQDNGNLSEEYHRLQLEAGANCVKEAAKHQNTYAFVSTVPLMDSYCEEDAEKGGIQSGKADCIENFTTYHPPHQNQDILELMREAIEILPAEEKKAVQLYHGLLCKDDTSDTKTLEEIGHLEGVTKERIRQRLTKARERMRRWLERKNIRTLSDAFSFP